MTETAGLLHDARLVARARLRRARGRLSGLSASERRAVEELAEGIAEAIAIELLDQVQGDGRVATPFAAISNLPKTG
jgi:hypothetical protein